MKKSSENKYFVYKRFINELIIIYGAIFLLYLIFNSFFPKIINLNESFFLGLVIVVLVIIFIRGILISKRLYKHLNRSDFIYELKNRDNAQEELRSFLLFYLELVDKYKMKLEILKSFTPVPFIVFALGVIWGKDDMIDYFELWSNQGSLYINQEQIIILSIFIATIYYLYSFISTWANYKYVLSSYYLYKIELENYKNTKYRLERANKQRIFKYITVKE